MAFFRRDSGAIERAATALAAAGGVAHAAFFTLFALRIIGRGGIGTVGYVVLALFALTGIALNFVGYGLIRSGGKPRTRRLGYLAVAVSTALAGGLLAIASMTA